MPEFLSGELFARFLGILAIDLILSGDNAVVIALAVRQLKGDTRRKAIILGATGAVLLRLFFAAIVTFLLQIPLLQAVGRRTPALGRLEARARQPRGRGE